LPDLDGPPVPASCRHIWGWFRELAAARGSNGFGPNPISYADIAAWSRLTRTIVRPIEVSVLLHLDHVFFAETATRPPPDKPQPGAKRGRRADVGDR
jgi:hypothetical protein